jgi:hypothetical protein
MIVVRTSTILMPRAIRIRKSVVQFDFEECFGIQNSVSVPSKSKAYCLLDMIRRDDTLSYTAHVPHKLADILRSRQLLQGIVCVWVRISY